MTTNHQNPIDAVRTRLDGGRLWMQGGFGDTAGNGPVCVRGAASSVGIPLEQVRALIDPVLLEQYPDRLYGDPTDVNIAHFNDHADTVWADVELVLDKAAIKWDEAL